MRKNIKKLIASGVVAGGLMLGAAGLLIGGGIAKASPYSEDQSGFVSSLRQDGFGSFPVDDALQMGERVCTMMRSGYSQHEVIEWLVDPPRPVPRLTAIDFVVDAHVYLCPDADDEGGTASTV